MSEKIRSLFSNWQYLLPSIALIVMVADSYGDFYRGNTYKTFLLYLIVTTLYFIVEWSGKVSLTKDRSFSVWMWAFLIFLPFVGTLPGLMVNGGEVNYRFSHELAVNIGYVLFFMYLYLTLNTSGNIERFIYIIGGVLIYSVIVGFYGVDFLFLLGEVQKSTFGNKNFYSNFLIIFLPLMLIMALPINLCRGKLFVWRKWSWKNSYFLLVAVMVVAGIAHAQTRSAIAGSLISLSIMAAYFLFFIVNRKYGIRAYQYALMVFLGFTVVSIVSYWLIDQVVDSFQEKSRFLNLVNWSAWAGRLFSWKTAVASIYDAVWLGWGAGSSYSLFFQYMLPDGLLYAPSSGSFDHVHNEWLEVLQEGGILGFSLYLYVIYMFFRFVIKGFNSEKLNNNEKKIVLGVGLGLVAYYFHSTFSLATRMTIAESGFVVVLALLAVTLKEKLFKGDQENDYRLIGSLEERRRWIVSALIIIMWAVGLPEINGDRDFRKMVREEILDKKESQDQVQKYINSPSVGLLERLAFLQIKRGEISMLTETLDEIDKKIPNYRDMHLYRAIDYQLTSGVEIDVSVFKRHIQGVLDVDIYQPIGLHWMARILAWERDDSGVLDQVKRLLQYSIFSAHIVPQWEVESIEVVLSDKLDGIAFSVSEQGVDVIIGDHFLEELSADLRKMNSQEEADLLLRKYADQIYLTAPEDTLHREQIEKLRSMVLSFLSRLAGWSMVPSI